MDAQAAVAVRPPATAALWRRARARLSRAQVHGRPLQRQSAGRHASRVLLAQHVRAGDAPALQPRGADAARGRARPSPADRARQGGQRTCRSSAATRYISAFGEGWGLYSEWLGLEVGFYTDPVQQLRPPDLRDVARRAARRRHRHARQGLDAPAVDRLPRGEHRAVDARVHDGDRSLHQLARTGARRTRSASSRSASCAPAPRRRSARSSTVRRFHDAVLANGSVPLPVLEQQIDAFIKEDRRAHARLPAAVASLSAFVPPGRLARPSTTPELPIRDPRNSRPRHSKCFTAGQTSCSGRVRPRATKIGRCCSYGMHSEHVAATHLPHVPEHRPCTAARC